MKVSELSGPALDEWVARSEGHVVEPRFRAEVNAEIMVIAVGTATRGVLHYSTDWACAGPIIEREKIGVTFGAAGNEWHAMVLAKGVLSVKWHLTGPTPLVAAMRSYVASKYGDEVPDE